MDGSGDLAYCLVHPSRQYHPGRMVERTTVTHGTLRGSLGTLVPITMLFRKPIRGSAAGALFHLTLLVLMDVGAFGYMSWAPITWLHPEVGRRVWERIHPFLRR